MRFLRSRRAIPWLLAGLLGQTPSFAQPAADDGRRLFEAGAEAYAKGQHELAIAAFSEAFRRTQRPGLLFSLAQAHRGAYEQSPSVEHLHAAVEYYAEYLKHTSAGPRADNARRYLAQLRSLGAQAPHETRPSSRREPGLVVGATVKGATLSIDGERSVAVPFAGTLTPGSHSLEISAPGYETFRREVDGRDQAPTTVMAELVALHGALAVSGHSGAEVSVDVYPAELCRSSRLHWRQVSMSSSFAKRGSWPRSRAC